MFPLKTWSPASSGALADKEMTERNIERYEVKSRHYYEAIPKVNLVSGQENGDWKKLINLEAYFRDELVLGNDEVT